MSSDAGEAKARFLRAMAFEVHRKRPAEEAMMETIEREGQRGRHRNLRPASAVLASDGVVAALKVAGMVGDEAALVLGFLLAAGDHRLLAGALNSLADFHEQPTGRG